MRLAAQLATKRRVTQPPLRSCLRTLVQETQAGSEMRIKFKFCCLKKDRQAQIGGTTRTWDDPWRDLGGGGRPVVLDLEEGERLNAEGMRATVRT